MSAITVHNWDLLSRYTSYGDLCRVPGVEGLTMVCYAQHFTQLHAGTQRRVYHNIPAWQWRPPMQLAAGRLLLLRCLTSRWKEPRSTPSSCPCAACQGSLEDPAGV